MVILTALFIACQLALPQIEQSVEIESQLLLVQQNRRYLQSMDITIDYVLSVPKHVAEIVSHEIEFANKAKSSLETAPLPVEFVDELKRRAKTQGITYEAVKTEWINETVERRKKSFLELQQEAGTSASYAKRYILTPDLMEVHLFLEPDSPKRQDAEKSGLPLQNAGDYRRMQRDTRGSSKWKGIEPYATATAGEASGWEAEIMRDPSIAPLYVDGSRMADNRSLGMPALFDAQAENGRVKIATRPNNDSETDIILMIPTGDSEFWLSHLDLTRSGVPAWNARCLLTESLRIQEYTSEHIQGLADYIESFRSSKKQAACNIAGVAEIFFFEDLRPVGGTAAYPYKIRRIQLGPLRHTGELVPLTEIPEGWTRVEEIIVRSLAVNNDVVPPSRLAFPNGMSIVDLDNKEAVSVGVSPEQAIRELAVDKNKKSTPSMLLLYLNIAAVLVIAVIAAVRHKVFKSKK